MLKYILMISELFYSYLVLPPSIAKRNIGRLKNSHCQSTARGGTASLLVEQGESVWRAVKTTSPQLARTSTVILNSVRGPDLPRAACSVDEGNFRRTSSTCPPAPTSQSSLVW